MVCVLSAAHTIALIFGNSYDFFLSCARFYLINKILFCRFGRIIHSQIVPDDCIQEEKKVLFLSLVCKCYALNSCLFGIRPSSLMFTASSDTHDCVLLFRSASPEVLPPRRLPARLRHLNCPHCAWLPAPASALQDPPQSLLAGKDC